MARFRLSGGMRGEDTGKMKQEEVVDCMDGAMRHGNMCVGRVRRLGGWKKVGRKW